MDWNRVEGNWKQIKGKVKEKWGNLTDDDLDKIAGAISSKEKFRSDMASPRIKPKRTLILGTTPRRGEIGLPHLQNSALLAG